MSQPQIKWGQDNIQIDSVLKANGALTVEGAATFSNGIDVTNGAIINGRVIFKSTPDFNGGLNCQGINAFNRSLFQGGVNFTKGASILASISEEGNGTFKSVSTPSLSLNSSSLTSVTTSSTSDPPTTSDESIPTVGYLTKAMTTAITTEPMQVIATSTTSPYTFEIRMWMKNADVPSQSSYFGKQYTYDAEGNVTEKTVSASNQQYPWSN